MQSWPPPVLATEFGMGFRRQPIGAPLWELLLIPVISTYRGLDAKLAKALRIATSGNATYQVRIQEEFDRHTAEQL